MRIAYLSSSRFPGLAANCVHVAKMCDAFNRNGHEVVLFAESAKRNASVAEILAPYGVASPYPLQLYPAGGWWRRRLNSARSALASRAFDIAYARNLPAALLAASMGQPTIVELHAPPAGAMSTFALGRLIRSQNLLRIVTITDALREHYEAEFDLHDTDIVVAPDGADPLDDEEWTPAFQKVAELEVGYVGHLYPGKGMEVVVPLARACPWAHFHVVGGTPEDIRYWSGIAGGLSNLSFHSHRPHSETAAFLRAFDVVLLPNQERVSGHGTEAGTSSVGRNSIGRWTSPLKMFEYMAAGKAIVASKLPVLQEVLRHGENALLCDPQRIEEWVSTLDGLRGDKPARKMLGLRAKADFLERYTWRARARRVLSQ